MSEAEVIDFPGITTLDSDAMRVLDAAKNAGVTVAIVIGTDAEGDLYFASSVADGGDALWWMELAKKRLLEVGS